MVSRTMLGHSSLKADSFNNLLFVLQFVETVNFEYRKIL